MAVQYIDNLSYKGKKPNFERDQFKTLAEMKAFSEADIDEGHSSYCLEDGKRYTFKSSNSVDPTTGRWRVENNPSVVGVEVPSNPQLGQIYFDTKFKRLGIWNGHAWIDSTGNPLGTKQHGTTKERPHGVHVGYIYYNTEKECFEAWNGLDNVWVPITYLVTSVNQITFSSDGGDMPFEVFSNAKWTAK